MSYFGTLPLSLADMRPQFPYPLVVGILLPDEDLRRRAKNYYRAIALVKGVYNIRLQSASDWQATLVIVSKIAAFLLPAIFIGVPWAAPLQKMPIASLIISVFPSMSYRVLVALSEEEPEADRFYSDVLLCRRQRLYPLDPGQIHQKQASIRESAGVWIASVVDFWRHCLYRISC